MNEASLPLTALSEAQRAQALERYTVIRPALEKEVSQAQVPRTHQLPPSTVQLWIKRYHEKGLAGLGYGPQALGKPSPPGITRDETRGGRSCLSPWSPSPGAVWLPACFPTNPLASPLLHPRLPSWIVERSFIPLLIQCLMMQVEHIKANCDSLGLKIADFQRTM